MKYVLGKLDRCLHSPHSLGVPLDEHFLQKEQKQIQEIIIEDVFRIADEKVIQLYIRHHQNGLVFLLNELDSERVKRSHDRYLLKAFRSTLEALLGFVERYFYQYFDRACYVADGYKKIVCNNILQAKTNLETNNWTRELRSAFENVFKERCDSIKLTYKQAFYLQELVHVVDLSMAVAEEQLLYLNFNDPLFYRYYTIKIRAALNECDTRFEKLEVLHRYLKDLKQQVRKPNVSYMDDHPPIVEWVLEWINEEIRYEEKLKPPVTPMPGISEPPVIYGKIETSLPVAQLAAMVRVFVDSGVLVNINQTQLMRMVVKTFTSLKKEEISLQSLRTRYYNVETGTKEAVKDVLIRMMNEVRRL